MGGAVELTLFGWIDFARSTVVFSFSLTLIRSVSSILDGTRSLSLILQSPTNCVPIISYPS